MSSSQSKRVHTALQSLSVTRCIVGLFFGGVLITHVPPLLAKSPDSETGSRAVSITVTALDSVAGESTEGGVSTLVAKPSSCVALHRGQICYQKIRLSWTSPDKAEYCLFSDTTNQQLACSNRGKSNYVHEYASESSETFSLRSQDTGLSLVTVVVSTAWVYRTGKRSSSGWRLF